MFGILENDGLRIGTVKKGKDLLEKDPVLRRIVEVIVREIDPDKIILFGSRARGDCTEGSDYDILVLKKGVRPEDRRRVEGKLLVEFLKARIYRDAVVDVIVQSPDKIEELKDVPYLVYYDAHREGVVIYEKERRCPEVAAVR